MKGVNGNCLELYLYEWMFKDGYIRGNFDILFELIKQ